MVRLTMWLIALLGVANPTAAGEGDLERAMALLATLDEVKISIDAEDVALEDVLPQLDAAHPAPLRADWRALDGLAVSRDDLVDLRLDNVSLATALAALVLQLGDVYDRPRIETHAGMLVLTTEEAAAGMRLAEVYDVRDLLADDAALARLRAAAPPIDPPAAPVSSPPDPATERPDEPEGKATPVPVRVLTPGERLMTMIADNVDPEAWLELGGTRASITERAGLLVVSAPATTHRRFHDVLRRLRRARPSGVAFTAAVIELPRGELDRLARRHDTGSAILARSLLASAAARTLWRAGGAVALDESWTVVSEETASRVELSVRPAVAAATGVLSIAVKLRMRGEGSERSLDTTATVPAPAGAAVLEVPGAGAPEGVRLLVIVPERG